MVLVEMAGERWAYSKTGETRSLLGSEGVYQCFNSLMPCTDEAGEPLLRPLAWANVRGRIM